MADGQPNVDRVFQALGDPTRRAMLERLTARPLSVSQLAASFQMTLAAVVQHLQILEESGLVRTEKLGRVRTCQLDPHGFKVAAEWLSARRTPLEESLDRLGDLLSAAKTP